jgi:hypothetical protein
VRVTSGRVAGPRARAAHRSPGCHRLLLRPAQLLTAFAACTPTLRRRWPDVTAAAKKAFTLRYQLLTYLYSSLFLAHAHGGTVARPLFFADPTDAAARNATKQWMLGDAVLISPVISPHTNALTAHFTAGAW